MSVNLIDKLQEKSELEFFTASLAVGYNYQTLSGVQRMEGWKRLCTDCNFALSGIFVTHKEHCSENVEILFQNGLKIDDLGQSVTFSAQRSKKYIDQKSAKTVVRCSANHLMRRGWNNGTVDISANRTGSIEMVDVFQKSVKDTQQKLDKELLGQLSNKRV